MVTAIVDGIIPAETGRLKQARQIRDDARDRIEIELFDSKQVEFHPQLKIMRWDDEANISMRFVGKRPDHPSISIEGLKTKYICPDYECHFLHIDACEMHPEGAIDFDLLLYAPPADNEVVFSIMGKDIEFLYQAPFTELYDVGDVCDGRRIGKITDLEIFDVRSQLIACREREEIVGSYAIYHVSPPTNVLGGKLYRSGKVGHIYYPYLIEANGNRVRAKKFKISYNPAIGRGICKIILPEGLEYPVLVDPTIGYTTLGASSASILSDYIWASGLSTTTDGTGGVVTVVHFGAKLAGGTTAAFQGGIYTTDASRARMSPQGATSAVTSNTKSWWDSEFTDGPELAANTNYFACVFVDGLAADVNQIVQYAYDSGGSTGDSRSWTSGLTYNTWPATLVTGTANTRKLSIYAEYSSSEPPSTVLPVILNGYTRRRSA